MELLILCYVVKHIFVDYVLQRIFKPKNKRRYGGRDGIMHANLHADTTFVLVTCWLLATHGASVSHLVTGLLMALIDGISHYHIDWVKSNLVHKYRLLTKPRLLFLANAIDQLLHITFYIIIIKIVIQ
jgi:hypothetical protein